jgi:uncharacterized protein YegL
LRRRIAAAVPLLLVITLLAALFSGDLGFRSQTLATCSSVDGGPGVDTDKEDYQPNETVIITGCAFDAYEGQLLDLSITRPDGVIDATTVIVSSGGFTYNYVLDGILGTYTIKVERGGVLLASTTFTDHMSTTLVINSNDAVTHSLSVTLLVSWDPSSGTHPGDPTQARFVNVTPTTLGCPSPLDPAWSPWVALTEIGTSNTASFPWTLAAGDHGHRKACIQTAHGPVGSPTAGTSLTADDTIWYTVANPALAESCGLDMVLVLDSSGSINSTELTQMKTAFTSFVSAFLPETPAEMAVVDFDDLATVVQGFTTNETDLNNAINGVAGGGATNWDDALFDARSLFPHRPLKQDLIVFASDGNPNRLGHIVSTSVTELDAMNAATDESDQAKTDGIRILGLGIGSDLDVVNMKAVTGNIQHPPAALSPAVDVITTDFSTLAADLADFAAELCGGTISVHKTIDGDGNLGTTGDQTDGAGWTFTTNVDPPDSSTPPSGDTDGSGDIIFDIDTGGDDVANVDVIEPGETGYGFLSASCTKPDGPDGDTDPDPVGTPAFGAVNDITVNKFDIISCVFYNVPLGSIEWEKRDESQLGNPLQGGASFTVGGATGPLACTGTPTNPLTVVDNGANDADPDPGQIKLDNVCAGAYTVTETVAPTGYAKDDDVTRAVTVSSPTLVQVIGTQGVDDPGNTDESDFHNRLGSIAWEKRSEAASPPHPLQGGATFTVGGASGPFACYGTVTNPITVVDNGANDADPDPGQVQVNNVCLGSYTVTETVAPAGYALDDDPTRAVTVSEADLNNVVGTQGSDDDGNTDESDFHNRLGSIEWEKREETGSPPHPLQGGASFTVGGLSGPFACAGNLINPVTVVDNGVNDADPDPGQIRVNNVCLGTYTVTETAAPTGYSLDDDPTRSVTVSEADLNAVIGTQGVDDEGNTDESDFHNVGAGTIIIIKDTVPDDSTDFEFACSSLGVFFLDDDADGTLSNTKTFPNVPTGSYQCTEQNEGGYQTTISCSDPDGGTTTSPMTAEIDLDQAETVTCTFTNTFSPGPPAVGGTAGLLETPHVNPASASTTDQLSVVVYFFLVLNLLIGSSFAGLYLLRRQSR